MERVRDRNSSEDDRLPRLDLRSGEEKFRLHLAECLFHQVVLTHRHPAGDQQQVGIKALAKQFPQALRFVRSNWQEHGLSSGSLYLGGEGIAVGVANLIYAGWKVNVNHFVPGREHCNPWLRMYHHA